MVAAAVEEPAGSTPRASPAIGSAYLVATGATRAWAGKDHQIPAYTIAGWRYIQPKDGMAAYVRQASIWVVYRSGSWESGVVRGSSLVLSGQQVVGQRGAAIASPAGGMTVDAEARAALAAVLAALRQHGLIET